MLAYGDDAGTTAGFGDHRLSGATYRATLTLESGRDEELFDRQVLVTVSEKAGLGAMVDCGGFSKSGLDDVRFATADGLVALPYARAWVRGELASRVAGYWVRVPRFSHGKARVTLYTGKSDADDISDPSSVFDAYFSFADSASLDAWKLGASPVQAEVIDGVFRLEGGRAVSKAYLDVEGRVVEWDSLTPENARFVLLPEGESPEIPITGSGAVAAVRRARIGIVSEPGSPQSVREIRVRKPDIAGLRVTAGTFEGTDNAMFDGVRLDNAGNLTCDLGEGRYLSPQFAFAQSPRILAGSMQKSGQASIAAVWGVSSVDLSSAAAVYAADGTFVPPSDAAISAVLGKGAVVRGIALMYARGSVTMMAPVQGERLFVGEDVDIAWSAEGYAPDRRMLLGYETDSGKKGVVATMPNSGRYRWVLPTCEGNTITITVSDAADGEVLGSVTCVLAQARAGSSAQDAVLISGDRTVIADATFVGKRIELGSPKGGEHTVLVIRDQAMTSCAALIVHPDAEVIFETTALFRVGGSVTIEKRGRISADGRGFAGGQPKSAGGGRVPGVYQSNGCGSGGTHGGVGGVTDALVFPSQAYDDLALPQSAGSSGGGSAVASGGASGGVIRIEADSIEVFGSVSANGSGGSIDPRGNYDAGGGAGGVVSLHARTKGLIAGRVSAVGGSGHVSGGGGGGGRISVSGVAIDNGTLDVAGGTGRVAGSSGSIVSGKKATS